MSLLLQNDVVTSFWRNYDVFIASCARCKDVTVLPLQIHKCTVVVIYQKVLLKMCSFRVHFQKVCISLRWRHNEWDGVSNHQPHDCLFNRLSGRRSKKTSKPCVTGLCTGNSPGTGEFPAQMASNAETVSIWWRYHVVAVFNVYSVNVT